MIWSEAIELATQQRRRRQDLFPPPEGDFNIYIFRTETILLEPISTKITTFNDVICHSFMICAGSRDWKPGGHWVRAGERRTETSPAAARLRERGALVKGPTSLPPLPSPSSSVSPAAWFSEIECMNVWQDLICPGLSRVCILAPRYCSLPCDILPLQMSTRARLIVATCAN